MTRHRPRAVWIAAVVIAALYATRLVGIWHYATAPHASSADESGNAPVVTR